MWNGHEIHATTSQQMLEKAPISNNYKPESFRFMASLGILWIKFNPIP